MTEMINEPILPTLERFVRVTLEVGAPTSIGETPNGVRRYVPILGGSFAGDAACGQVLPGGGDWILQRSDGVTLIDARYSIETDSGAVIYIQDKGYRHGPAEVMAELARGGSVSPDQFYFRTTAQLECAAPELSWINRTLFIGTGMRAANQVMVDFYAVR